MAVQPAFPGYFFPKGVVEQIFNFLPPKEFARLSIVSKTWLAFNQSILEKQFPEDQFPVRVIDGAVWKKFVGSDDVRAKSNLNVLEINLTNVPSYTRRSALAIVAPYRHLKIMENAGVTLMVFPKNLGEGSCIKFAKSPLEGNAIDLKIEIIQSNHRYSGTRPIKETETLVLTNNELLESPSALLEQSKYLKNKCQMQLPSPLHLKALICLTYVVFKKWLFENNCVRSNHHPWTIGCSFFKQTLDIEDLNFNHYGIAGCGDPFEKEEENTNSTSEQTANIGRLMNQLNGKGI